VALALKLATLPSGKFLRVSITLEIIGASRLTSIGRDFPASFLVSFGTSLISRSASSRLALPSPASSIRQAAAELTSVWFGVSCQVTD